MSKIEWEYELVEKPFCERLKALGWQWIEGDKSCLMAGLLTGLVRVPATVAVSCEPLDRRLDRYLADACPKLDP